jgi:uncharacterized protein YegL
MKTHVTFILDSSGSMNKIEEDTKSGFNSLLEDQRKESGEATVTLYEFNSTVERLFRAVPINDVPELTEETYTPGGNTALHDAMATAIKETGQRIVDLPNSDQPDHVLVVVLTDGKENASETPIETIEELVELRQDEHDWEFLFIGANQDAVFTAEKMGLKENRAMTMAYNEEGTRSAYESTSDQLSQMRREGSTDGFDAEDRKQQKEARDS